MDKQLNTRFLDSKAYKKIVKLSSEELENTKETYWLCTQFRPLFAVFLVVHLNKHNVDNEVFVT